MLKIITMIGFVGVASSAAAAETFTLVERVDHEVSVARLKGKDSLGDQVIFHNSLFDSGNKTAAGHDNGACVRTVVGETYQCTITLSLADGDLIAIGTFSDKGDSVLAVFGGTKAFGGATGSMTIHSRSAELYDFTFELK
jgi:allene oxide cyclase